MEIKCFLSPPDLWDEGKEVLKIITSVSLILYLREKNIHTSKQQKKKAQRGGKEETSE